MERGQIDQMYHCLRAASNILEAENTMKMNGERINLDTGLTPQEEVNILYGLCRHLLAGGDYSALIRFSRYYGLRFLLEPVHQALQKAGWEPLRIVEFGAGLGWLGRGLASKLGFLPALFVDKRPWLLIDVVADLETPDGVEAVLSKMKPCDLIVASDFLHCLDRPMDVMEQFSKWPMALLEYCSTEESYEASYSIQIERYGARSILPQSFMAMFPGRKVDIVDIDPYILILVEAAQ